MKIYVLLRQDYEGSETICVSEDITKIRETFDEYDLSSEYLELEVWKNGEQINRITGDDAYKKVVEGKI